MTFEKYLINESISLNEAAKAIGVTYEAVRLYCRGKRIPRVEIRKKIQDWSGGKVTPNDFYLSGSSLGNPDDAA